MLTVQQVAIELGLKESTVRSWLIRRKISFVKLGRCVRVSREEVARLIKENTFLARELRR